MQTSSELAPAGPAALAGAGAQTEVTASTVLVIAAAAAMTAIPPVLAATHGWDYRVAAMIGALLAALVAWSRWRSLPENRVRERAALAFPGALALGLTVVYECEVFDVRFPGIGDAHTGTALALVLLAAWPVRYVLRHVDALPKNAAFAAIALALAPALWSMAVAETAFADAPEQGLAVRLVGGAATMLLGALAFAFARRHRLFRTAALIVGLAPAPVLHLLLGGSHGVRVAVASGVLVAATAIALAIRDAGGARRPLARPGWAALRGTLATACASAVRWGVARRDALVRAANRELGLADLRQSAIRLGLAAAILVTGFSHWFLLVAAWQDATGPMVLAKLRDLGVYRASDYTFATALVRDTYLWRGSARSRGRLSTASVGEYVAALADDRWNTALPLTERLARETRETKGYGLLFRWAGEDRLKVRYVYSDSPAHAVGVGRGDLIEAIGGVPVAQLDDDLERVTRRLAGEPMHLQVVTPTGEVREVVLAQSSYPRPALAVEKRIEIDGRRVGYLLLADFLRTADAEFEAAAKRLHEQGIDELVLDLRTNPGGVLEISRNVASVIAGRTHDGKVFLRVVHNDRYRDRDRDVVLGAPAWGGLSLARVLVITSEDSCSASEALINGLRPHIEVVTVGGKTCGKPVGSRTVHYGDYSYSVISFRVVNARGKARYYAGLRPTCAAKDEATREYGDAEEASLHTALHYIRFGRCPEPSAGPGLL